MTKITEKLYVNREDWRAWLEKNHDTEKEVWLIYYKKHTGKPRISYGDAVEEALCYGWIDSIVKRIDDERFAQKFTPRKNKSKWSELNIKRARKMIKQGRMAKAGLAKFKEIEKNDKRVLKAKPSKEELVIPSDLKEALKANKRAWENFNNFAPSYKRLYIRWIMDAKRKETRERRIKRTVKYAEENKKSVML